LTIFFKKKVHKLIEYIFTLILNIIHISGFSTQESWFPAVPGGPVKTGILDLTPENGGDSIGLAINRVIAWNL